MLICKMASFFFLCLSYAYISLMADKLLAFAQSDDGAQGRRVVDLGPNGMAEEWGMIG